MKTAAAALLLLVLPVTAAAADEVTGTNYVVADVQNWPTGKLTGYWILEAEGIAHYDTGPLPTGAIECHGAGYWDADVTWGEGICINTDERGTRLSTWRRGQGEAEGVWNIVSGTGDYEGMTGTGTYRPVTLTDGRIVSHLKGEVTFAD